MTKSIAIRITIAIAIGVGVTILLAVAASFAFQEGAHSISRALFWQNSLLQSFFRPHNIGTAERPFYEATPLNIVAYFASYPVGAIAYAAIAYLWLSRRKGQS